MKYAASIPVSQNIYKNGRRPAPYVAYPPRKRRAYNKRKSAYNPYMARYARGAANNWIRTQSNRSYKGIKRRLSRRYSRPSPTPNVMTPFLHGTMYPNDNTSLKYTGCPDGTQQDILPCLDFLERAINVPAGKWLHILVLPIPLSPMAYILTDSPRINVNYINMEKMASFETIFSNPNSSSSIFPDGVTSFRIMSNTIRVMNISPAQNRGGAFFVRDIDAKLTLSETGATTGDSIAEITFCNLIEGFPQLNTSMNDDTSKYQMTDGAEGIYALCGNATGSYPFAEVISTRRTVHGSHGANHIIPLTNSNFAKIAYDGDPDMMTKGWDNQVGSKYIKYYNGTGIDQNFVVKVTQAVDFLCDDQKNLSAFAQPAPKYNPREMAIYQSFQKYRNQTYLAKDNPDFVKIVKGIARGIKSVAGGVLKYGPTAMSVARYLV